MNNNNTLTHIEIITNHSHAGHSCVQVELNTLNLGSTWQVLSGGQERDNWITEGRGITAEEAARIVPAIW